MRKSSLAAVFVVLLVGLAAAYRAGRVETAPETSPRPRVEGGEPSPSASPRAPGAVSGARDARARGPRANQRPRSRDARPEHTRPNGAPSRQSGPGRRSARAGDILAMAAPAAVTQAPVRTEKVGEAGSTARCRSVGSPPSAHLPNLRSTLIRRKTKRPQQPTTRNPTGALRPRFPSVRPPRSGRRCRGASIRAPTIFPASPGVPDRSEARLRMPSRRSSRETRGGPACSPRASRFRGMRKPATGSSG
jgi:hypothetical protein